jgi:hypothetical protein
MPLMAKRKIRETWREAVAARVQGNGEAERCLALYDATESAGASASEAAFRALEACGLLWEIAGPDDPGPPSRPVAEAQARDPHRVPNV